MPSHETERKVQIIAREREDVTGDELEALLSSVLAEHAGYRPRALDGVLVVQHIRRGSIFEVKAIAILVDDQLVEPAIFLLAFGSEGHIASVSEILFGSSAAVGTPYGGPEHNRLVNRLLCEPPQVLPWAYEFRRSKDVWHRSGGVA